MTAIKAIIAKLRYLSLGEAQSFADVLRKFLAAILPPQVLLEEAMRSLIASLLRLFYGQYLSSHNLLQPMTLYLARLDGSN